MRSIHALSLSGIALAGCLAAVLAVQEGPREAGVTALMNRDWTMAAEKFAEALAAAASGQDEILYLLASAHQNGGQHEAALAALDRLLKEHPASALRMKALFKKGDILAAKKEFALAASIYDAQVAALTAPERRRRIAMIYVDAGREFLKAKDPKDLTFQPDPAAAHRLLSKSLELEALGAEEEGVRADLIACEMKDFPPEQLLKSCNAFEEKFPASARMDEVLFARGAALRGLKRSWDAEKAWTRLADRYPASKRASEALTAAALLHVDEKGVWKGMESLRRALPLLRRVAKDFAASEQGPKAALLAGLALSQDEDLREEARRELTAFVEANVKHERAPEALLRVAELHREDQDEARAIAVYEDFLKRFPDSPLWPEARQAIATIRFERIGRAKVLKDWPRVQALAREFGELHATDGRAVQAAFELGAALKEQKMFREAVEAWMKAAEKYPDEEKGKEARFRAAELMAAELDDYETAMKELEKVPGMGAGLLRALREPSLAVSSDRVFRVGEAAAFKVAARNVECVKVRLWSLDLKDYFEKKASTSGIQNLDVSVIAPDREWEVPVKDYRPYKEMKFDVELPKKDPGATIVTASAGRIEATTVVLVSDLAVIARAGRKGAAVMAENMRTGEQVANPVLSTAADGKALKAWAKETTASRLSFMAEAPGGVAFLDMDVSGLPVPPARQAAAAIVPDRLVYGPEDEVRLRIVVRDVEGGAFVPPKERVCRVEARTLGPVATVFAEADVELSRWGSGAASFRLLPGFQGDFLVMVLEKARPRERCLGLQKLHVANNRPREGRIDFLDDDKAVFAGDPVEATGVLRDAWGRPMPGRRVEVLTPDDLEWRELRTAADGTFPVSVRETGRFAGGGTARIRARAAGLEETWEVPILSRSVFLSFDDSCRLHEPLPVGEARTLSFSARLADDTPVRRAFRWRVVRSNEAGERSVAASGEVVTDGEGKGSFSFAPTGGGLHLVTVLAKDEDGLPVRLRSPLVAFGDGEEAKLRILSASDEFDPGKPFEIQVHSRLDRGLAFVAVESEAIEQVVPVTLEKGRNAVRLGPPPGATRDFSVSVMMMQGNAFHSETRDFRIRRPEVKVEPSKKEYLPGEEASVCVTAPPGSDVVLAVSGRLKMAMPVDAFLPAREGRYFRAESSAALAFAGRTTEVDARVFSALERWAALDTHREVRVMMPKEEPPVLDLVGEGGGGGGRYAGRAGGKRQSISRGGGGSAAEEPGAPRESDPAPLFFGAAAAGADGRATFSFPLPPAWGNYEVRAWVVDGSNGIASGAGVVRSRAAVTAEVRAPDSAVEGEKTSVVALLTNRSKQEQEVTLSFRGEVKVRVPARSTVEKVLDWVAAPSAVFAVDGVRRELKVEMRPAGPSVMAEAGGAFAAKAELAPAGQGKIAVRYAVGPAALLESLAEGNDPLASASDAAARLIAWVARHRYAKTDAAKRAVVEYKARRALGLEDAAGGDAAWPILLYLAEAEAKTAEFDVKPDSALLRQRFAQAASDDVKAVMLFALSRGGEAEYGSVHRLWRSADALSPRALASVALALQAAKKTDEAKAAVARLLKAAREDHWDAVEIGVPDASNTSYGATALAAFAVAEIEPANPMLARARAWLLARAPSAPFERAMLALAMQSTADRSAVTELKVGGIPVKGFGEIRVDRATIEPVGEGTFYALARRPTGKAPESPVRVEVKRTNRWPALVVEGEVASREAVAAGPPFENPSMERVAAGEGFRIDFEVRVPGPLRRYLVVEFPRITGLRIPPELLRVLIPPHEEGESKRHFSAWAYADLPGVYPGMTVLPAGSDYRAGWSMTPEERLAAGALRFERKRWKEARDTLAPLFEKGTLAEEAAIEAARMLAYSAAELEEHETVVRFFEVLKEKSPGEVVPFDRVRAVGRAYAAVNEHERAMQVHAGTCDAYFLQEANVVGALEGLGRSRQAAAVMNRLVSEYPDTPLNREMLYGLAVKLYWAAKDAPIAADKDGKRLNRAETLKECVSALERTLLSFPLHPDADRAALTLGSAHLEAGNHAAAERAARAAAARYPKSRHRDGFDYTAAFACFGQRRFDEALVLCDRLETFDYGTREDRGPGVMRDRAVLMKAQIFHAKGDLEKALENYKKLKASSPDAARSAAFLEKEAISVPELTTVPLAKPAEIELEYSGVKGAQVRAYKVDLTALMLRRKGSVTASSIEVAGIKPILDRAFDLGAPNTRRRERQKLALDLKDPGAYVVNVKAGDFFASGLLLRSDLAMAVQEDGDGTVRVNVSNVAANAFAEGVKVTIFGTDDFRIQNDKTDLRGIWEASDVRGTAVVVAEKDGHVAMYRGQAASPPPRGAQTAAPPKPEAPVDALQEQLKDLNREAESLYKGNVERRQEGVEVERTKKK